MLYEKNATTVCGMASTTKIMTALVALESGLDPSEIITIPAKACGIEGSSIYLETGEKMTLGDLLHALLLASANDAAMAIAIAVSGSEDAFVDKMNTMALNLGLTNTRFSNPHGLDEEGHHTTALELAILTDRALENETFAEIVSKKAAMIPGKDGTVRHLTNHNRLLRENNHIYGVKTGFTKATGRCLVSAGEKNGVDLIAVTLGAPDDWNDHRTMYEYGFTCLSWYEVISPGQIQTEVDVVGGSGARVKIGNARSFSLCAEHEPRPEIVLHLPQFVFAPIVKGQVVGEVVLLDNGEEIGRLPLAAMEDVSPKEIEKGFFARIFDSIIAFFKELFGA